MPPRPFFDSGCRTLHCVASEGRQEGGRVQESKNGRAKLDANLAGLGGAQNQRWHSATPDHENIQFSNNVGTRASYEDGPKSRAANFLSSDSASGPAECLRGSARYVLYLSYSTPTKGIWPTRCTWACYNSGKERIAHS